MAAEVYYLFEHRSAQGVVLRVARERFRCAYCGARPGEPCRTPPGRMRMPHADRMHRMRRWAQLYREDVDQVVDLKRRLGALEDRGQRGSSSWTRMAGALHRVLHRLDEDRLTARELDALVVLRGALLDEEPGAWAPRAGA